MAAHPKNDVAFWGLAVRTGDGCLVWHGFITADGYGQYGSVRAHRVAFQKANGPIPSGMTIDHLCRNTLCINPDHLEAVPILENVRRGQRFTAVACRHGHPYNEENTRVETDQRGRTSRRCRPCNAAAQRRRSVGIR